MTRKMSSLVCEFFQKLLYFACRNITSVGFEVEEKQINRWNRIFFYQVDQPVSTSFAFGNITVQDAQFANSKPTWDHITQAGFRKQNIDSAFNVILDVTKPLEFADTRFERSCQDNPIIRQVPLPSQAKLVVVLRSQRDEED